MQFNRMGLTRAQLIQEYQRIRAESPTAILGERTFQSITRLSRSNWRGKNGFRNFGELVTAAVGVANLPDRRRGKDFLISNLARLTQKNLRFPTEPDIFIERENNKDFPSKNALSKLGSYQERIRMVRQYATEHPEFADILDILPQISEPEDETEGRSQSATQAGYVYMALLKLGQQKRYKIGKAVLVDRRQSQISIQLPEDLELIHSITTDDAYGIEAYWHKRFASKNTKGEWFSLSREDVQAFRRRKFM